MIDKRPFLTTTDLSFVFAEQLHVLDGISLHIQEGAFVALVGPSGVGKSTLLRLFGGLLPPTSGQVLLQGQPPLAHRSPIGIVFQRDGLMPWRTVWDNVALPLELQGVQKGEMRNGRIQAMLDLVGLNGFEHSYPAQLSGGMAQRVSIARALVHEPALLLLDEPFGALDALTRERMGQELLHIWQAMPVTVFMVTHSIMEAVLLADEVLVMNGQPATGNPAKITARIPINLPRPRHLEMQATADFQQDVATIRQAIAGFP
ncbi:MAG: ABC transporter ATP-binding protein [Ardenticatenaceae bacterium]|nr:ABC transporter ATP-binding protein [Ardenticatenaceae bacterium]